MNDALQLLALAGRDFLSQILTLLLGFSVLALALHLLERRISRRLSHRFGWRSVLVTGWLGVPVHELSHLLFCWIFRHRIVARSFLDPDTRTGTLGYVQHAYRRRNLYQLAGNFFIGISPLLLGSLVLLIALVLLLPAARPAVAIDPVPLRIEGQLWQIVTLSQATLHKTFTLAHLASWQFWVFLLLALCIGSHMSPSRPDLQGSLPGLAVLVTGLYGLNVLNRFFVFWDPMAWARVTAGVLSPLLAVLCVVLLLQVLYLGAVELIVRLTTPRRGMTLGYADLS